MEGTCHTADACLPTRAGQMVTPADVNSADACCQSGQAAGRPTATYAAYAAAERIAVAAARRVPRAGRVGMFCREGGGMQSPGTFFWFDDMEALRRFVGEALVPFHTSAGLLDRAETSPTLGCVDGAEVARLVPDLSAATAAERDARREAVNVLLSGLVHVEWWGTYADMMTGMDPFACRVRLTFSQDVWRSWSSEGCDGMISFSDRSRFRRFLHHYGGF